MKAIQIYYKLKEVYDKDQGKTLSDMPVSMTLRADGETYVRNMEKCSISQNGTLVIESK